MKNLKGIRAIVFVPAHGDGPAAAEIENALLGIDAVFASTQEEYEKALVEFRPSVVVAQCNGKELECAVEAAREVLPGVPFIVLADRSKESDIPACLEAGASDYVFKDQLRGLPFIIQSAVAVKVGHEVATAQKEAGHKRPVPRIASLLNHLPCIVYRCRNDRSWTMEFISEGCFAITGYLPEEIEQNRVVSFGELIHPEDRDRVYREVQNALERFSPFHLTYRITDKNGETRWMWEYGEGVRENGDLFLDGFIWEITAQKVAEQRLFEQHRQFATFMENTRSLLAILDKDARYEYVSPSHKDLLGYEPAELVGRSGFDLIHPDETDRLLKLLAKGLAGETRRVFGIEYRAIDKGGNVRYLRGNFDSILDEKGRLEKIISVGDDVTDLKRAEEELDKERERFKALVEKAPLGIIMLDQNGRLLYANPGVSAIFGVEPGDVETFDEFLKIIFPGEEYRMQVERLLADDLKKAPEGMLPYRKHTAACKDGSEKIVMMTLAAMERGEKLVVFQDVTRRETLEAQLMHAQKMESIGRLASGIAHDFNNLLTSITGNAEFALMDIKPQDPLYEVIEDIKSAADKAASLTRQLLTFGRRQNQNPEVIEINERIAETKRMLGRIIGENINLKLNLAEDAGRIEIDPGQLEQLVTNLAVNAKDAMPNGGTLTIETANVELDESDPTAPVEMAAGRYVLISVTDTGFGMSKEVLDHVFEPFFTTKPQGKGTGLGLSTVYGIVRQNRGSILIHSEPGKGTTVKVFFPRYENGEEQPAAARGKKRVKSLQGSETVLVAEDEPRVRKVVSAMLARNGYNVIEAESGEEALTLFESLHRRADLLLTDMVMPGINGLELAKQLRKRDPSIKVVCMSGYTDASIFEGAKEEGFAFIHKPFTREGLLEKVREVLDS